MVVIPAAATSRASSDAGRFPAPAPFAEVHHPLARVHRDRQPRRAATPRQRREPAGLERRRRAHDHPLDPERDQGKRLLGRRDAPPGLQAHGHPANQLRDEPGLLPEAEHPVEIHDVDPPRAVAGVALGDRERIVVVDDLGAGVAAPHAHDPPGPDVDGGVQFHAMVEASRAARQVAACSP